MMESTLNVEIELSSVPEPTKETPTLEGKRALGTPIESAGAEGKDAKRGRNSKIPWLRAVEVTALSAAVVIVWGLLTVPIVFYFRLPASDGGIGSNRSACEQNDVTKYTGTVCTRPLLSCLTSTPGAGDIFVSSTVSQDEAEETATLLEFGLDQLDASDDCRQAALPFVCLYLFGLCDGNGTLHSPSLVDCLHISTELCAAEWAAGQGLGLPLPECSSLPEQSTVICETGGNHEISANTTTSSPVPTTPAAPAPSDTSPNTSVSVGTNCTVQCRDSFYCTPENTCKPRCGSWKQYSHAVSLASDVVVIISAVVGVTAGGVIFAITCIQRKQLLVFPAVIVQYSTLICVILASVVLISYLDRTDLFCSSIDLQTSIENTTPFCSFTGVVVYFTLLQLAMWWFFHVAILFWNVQFPFHARRFKQTNRMKYLHIAMVIMAFVVPVLPVAAEAADGGFKITRFPPILCTGTSSQVIFYGVALPIILVLQVGITLLIVIFRTIHKHHGLFREKISKRPIIISSAERKLLIVFCYFVTLGAIALTSFSLGIKNFPDFIQTILFNFSCELHGINPDCDESRNRIEEMGGPVLAALAYILLGLFPAVNLIYVINVKKVSQCYHKVVSTSRSSGQ